jgi:hypothetical protein
MSFEDYVWLPIENDERYFEKIDTSHINKINKGSSSIFSLLNDMLIDLSDNNEYEKCIHICNQFNVDQISNYNSVYDILCYVKYATRKLHIPCIISAYEAYKTLNNNIKNDVKKGLHYLDIMDHSWEYYSIYMNTTKISRYRLQYYTKWATGKINKNWDRLMQFGKTLNYVLYKNKIIIDNNYPIWYILMLLYEIDKLQLLNDMKFIIFNYLHDDNELILK